MHIIRLIVLSELNIATIITQKNVNSLKMPINGWDGLAYKSYWLRDHFLLAARSDHTTGSRNLKPEVEVQKMARYASFCLIMGAFKGEVPVFARLWPIWVRSRVSFTTGVDTVGHPSNSWASCLIYLHPRCGNSPTGQTRSVG